MNFPSIKGKNMFVDNVKNSISIILQGGVFKKDIDNVTNIAMQYRELFPSSQIIMSVSSSDFFEFKFIF